jgi:sulfate adenylyltransferase
MPELESIDGVPVWHPPLAVLELAELVVTGALDEAPALGELAGHTAPVVLEDAEGTPVARYTPGQGFEPLRPFTHGPARAARRTPAAVRAELAPPGPPGHRPVGRGSLTAEGGPVVEGGPVAEGGPLVEGGPGGVAPGGGDEGLTGPAPDALVVPVTGVLGRSQVEAVIAQGRPVVWLAVLGAGRTSALPAGSLARAVRALAEATREAGGQAVAAAVAVPRLPGEDDRVLVARVARAYADEVVPDAEAQGEPHPAFAVELDRVSRHRGLTVFFTGLSGSGKSTVAKALAERIEEHRAVSLLDGDEVRRLLSAGLTFSRADRDLNIRRIGFVAAEVTRHGGIAVCAPIAPFEQAREQVRASVEEVGAFVLVHVNTSLEECERRDRKGLYAKARQGIVKDFTGISSPYEEPVAPELRIDTERISVDDAVNQVWHLLTERGYV